MPLQLVVEKAVPDMLVQDIEGGRLWTSSKNALYFSDDRGDSFKKIAEVPCSPVLRILGHYRLPRKALRLGIRGMRKLKSGTVLVIANKALFRYNNDRFEQVYFFRKGFGPLRQGWCEDDQGNCYLSEYFINPDRTTPVQLSKSTDDGQTWHAVHTYPNVRHIHLVQMDPYTRSIWVGTGDRDHESAISFSNDGGATWTPIGSGDQMFRAVSLIFTEDHIYWGTDAPTRQNHIYRYHRLDQKVERLAPVSSPVHYSTILKSGIKLFGTAAEGKSEGESAAWDNKAHIWGSENGTDWQDLISWEKDIWPHIVGFGRFYFPSGEGGDTLYFSGEALKNVDGVLMRAKVTPHSR